MGHRPASQTAGQEAAGHGAEAHAHGGHGAVGHVAPLRALIGTGAALLVLTWLTVAVTRVDLGELNIFVALGVATVKAGLVMLFFMHLRWDRPFNAIVCIGSIAFVALMIAFTILDTAEYQDTINPGDAKAVRETIESLGN